MLKHLSELTPLSRLTASIDTILPPQNGDNAGKHAAKCDKRKSSAWTEDALAYCRLNAKTMSASEMALALANGLTRSAVAGMMYRLGVPLASERKNGFSGRAKSPEKPIEKLAPPAPVGQAIDERFRPKMLTIAQLTPRSCRWPINDPRFDDFGYCGHETTAPGRSYCALHSRIGYRKAESEK